MPAAAAHLPRAQSEVGAGHRVTSQCGDTLGCRVSAQLVAVWLLCEKYRYDLLYLASVLRSLVHSHYAVLSLYWKYIFCENSNVRGFIWSS